MSPEVTDVYNFESLDSSQDQCHLKLLLFKIIRLWIADKIKCSLELLMFIIVRF